MEKRREVHVDIRAHTVDADAVLLETRRSVVEREVFSSIDEGITHKTRAVAYERTKQAGSLSAAYITLGLGLDALVDGIGRRDYYRIGEGIMFLVAASDLGSRFVRLEKPLQYTKAQLAKLRERSR